MKSLTVCKATIKLPPEDHAALCNALRRRGVAWHEGLAQLEELAQRAGRIAILAQLAEWERAEDATARTGFYETATQTPDGWRHVER